MDKEATVQVLAIVELLANGADHNRLAPNEESSLNQNVTALMQHDGDDFVRSFLAALKLASDVLTPDAIQKLAVYP